MGLPAVMGFEGIGEVMELGSEAAKDGALTVGQRVVAPEGFKSGSWSTECVEPVSSLLVIPPSADEIMASMLTVNPPTAYGLLRHAGSGDEAPVAGDWVIQNLANSGVGVAVIQVARDFGIKVVNVVRSERAADLIRDLSPDAVVVYDEGGDMDAAAKQVKTATGGAKIRLALNGVGGDSSKLLLKCLANSGTMFTYGNMARKPMEVGGGQLIFKDLRLQGFHLGRCISSMSLAEKKAMWDFTAALAGKGFRTATSVEKVYPLAEAAQAVDHAFSRASGKVLLRCS